MKLLIVSTSFPMKQGDSLTPFLWGYCLGLKNRGWDITVLAPHHRGLMREENWDNIDVKRFKYLPERYEDLAYSGGLLPGLRKSPWKLIKMPFYIFSMYSEALRIIAADEYDLVNFHWLFPACFWLTRFHVKTATPIVLTGHGTDVRLAAKFPFRQFARRGLGAASAVTLNSEYMKEILRELKTSARIEVIPMGVDTEEFRPGASGPSDSKKILFIGRLIEQKGVGVLLESFQEISRQAPDSELEIIGYGPLRDALGKRIDELGLSGRARISDPIGHGLLPEKYRSARALALPSLIPEGLGMTAVEAGACGVPAITFGLGGTSEFVIDGDTGLVTAANKNALSAGLARILRDDDLADRLGSNARRAALERYSWPVVAEKFDSLFRRLV